MLCLRNLLESSLLLFDWRLGRRGEFARRIGERARKHLYGIQPAFAE